MQTPKSKRIAIIGGGIAGIACALRLKAMGHDVVMYDKHHSLGGKIAEIVLGDFRFDMGPSLFTEPWLVDELFELFGKNPRNYFQFVKVKENCRYFFLPLSHRAYPLQSFWMDDQIPAKMESDHAWFDGIFLVCFGCILWFWILLFDRLALANQG